MNGMQTEKNKQSIEKKNKCQMSLRFMRSESDTQRKFNEEPTRNLTICVTHGDKNISIATSILFLKSQTELKCNLIFMNHDAIFQYSQPPSTMYQLFS